MTELEIWYRAGVFNGQIVMRLNFSHPMRPTNLESEGYRRTKVEALEHLRDRLRQQHRKLQEQATRLSRLAALADEQALALRMAERLEVADD